MWDFLSDGTCTAGGASALAVRVDGLALRLGESEAQRLWRLFVQATGVTPTEYERLPYGRREGYQGA